VFELIEAEKAQFSIRMMCTVLEASRSGYYAWLRRPASKRSGEQEKLEGSIQAVHHRAGHVW